MKKKQLIKLLKSFYLINKYIPTKTKRHPGLPHSSLFVYHFGSWNKALFAAGLPVTRILNPPVETTCTQCAKLIKIQLTQLKHKSRKTSNCFCSQSCAATYNNTHKTVGIRRSKLEIYLEEQLPKLYPNFILIAKMQLVLN